MPSSENNDLLYPTNSKYDTNIKFKIFENTSTPVFPIIIFGAALILISVFFVLLISWVIKKRKYRQLRHRLIPLYSFDPNEEDVWETDFLNASSRSSTPKSQDYHSTDLQDGSIFIS